MAIHRRFLYAGLFLIAAGGVMVAADLATGDDAVVRQALRLWPLVIIAIGLALALRRTRLSLPAGMLAAVAPGLLLGGTFAIGPQVTWECNGTQAPPMTFDQDGALFGTDTSVSIGTGCGSSTITTVPGNRWHLLAGASDASAPNVSADSRQLQILSSGRGGRQLVLGDRREAWDLTLPATTVASLGITANANDMALNLPGARLESLDVDANASSVRIDATQAAIDQVYVAINFGTVWVNLPSGPHTSGSFDVNAGNLRLCQPPGVGMTVSFAGNELRDVKVGGVHWSADQWTSERDVLSANQIELTVDATLGSVEINPIGGCS